MKYRGFVIEKEDGWFYVYYPDGRHGGEANSLQGAKNIIDDLIDG